MNDSPRKENDDAMQMQRMLEDVTAADGATRNADGDDRETAGLKAAWLAFGQLLDSANSAEFQPSGVIARTKRMLAVESAAKRRRYAGAVAAVAAALCIALGLGWWLARDGRQLNHNAPEAAQASPAKPQPAQVNPAPQLNPAPQATAMADNSNNDNFNKAEKKKTSVKQSPSSSKQSAWDDTIDTQITSVSRQIDAVRQTWQHRVDEVDIVQYHIDDVSAGLKDDAL